VIRGRRRVELVYFPVIPPTTEVDMPEGAAIVAVDFHAPDGLMQGRRPCGVWAEVTLGRYDEVTP
jgi:hypothetical protein